MDQRVGMDGSTQCQGEENRYCVGLMMAVLIMVAWRNAHMVRARGLISACYNSGLFFLTISCLREDWRIRKAGNFDRDILIGGLLD